VHHPVRPSAWIYRTGDRAKVGDDGLVHFLGRADSQIESRGYRIELGEIEAAINTVSGVVECAVLALASEGLEGGAICAAYLPVTGSHVTPATLRADLARLIPAHMVPTRWLRLDAFPVNANGKVDRHRLKDAFAAGIDAHAAQTA
jgi:acyl-coenzyme A synthetase/AMP-(fatty) acid ligase